MKQPFSALTAMLIAFVATGCSLIGTDLQNQASSTSDTTPPSFSGLKSIHTDGLTRAVLSWDKASDETSPESNIIYLVWKGSKPDVPTDGPPSYVAPPRVTNFDVLNLPAFQPTYFVVQAKDSAGNLDGNSTSMAASSTFGIWDFVDGNASSGINSNDIVRSTEMVAVGNRLFAMWTEAPSSGLEQYCRVAEFNKNDLAPAWIFVDPGLPGGINYNPAAVVSSGYKDLSLASFDTHLYASWPEYDAVTGADQLRVAVYDPENPGNGWSFVENQPPQNYGLNIDTTADASTPTLIVGDGTLWAIWQETGVGPGQIRSASYNGVDGAPVWTPVDSGVPTTGINYAPSMSATSPTGAYLDGHLVAAWIENGLVRAKAYDGSSWSSIDNMIGLNYDLGQPPNNLDMGVAGNKLYLTWTEFDTVSGFIQVRVREFGGDFAVPSWQFVDGGLNIGINVNPNNNASTPRIIALNGGLVVAYREYNVTANQVRVRAFNGDTSSPAWSTVDNGGSSGLNHDPAKEANGGPSGIGFDGRLYLSWPETSTAPYVEERVIRGR